MDNSLDSHLPEYAAAERQSVASVLVANVLTPDVTTKYRSVNAAFHALNLPIQAHRSFRRQLKLAGTARIDNFIFTAVFKKDTNR